MWQTREGAEQRAGHLAILSYKTSQTRSVQCGITQGFPCGGSGTPNMKQNGFPENQDGERRKSSPLHILTETWECAFQETFTAPFLPVILPDIQPYHWERFCQVHGGKNSSQCQKFGAAKTSSSLNLFHSFVHNRGHTPGASHLYPIPQCKLQDGLCWAALAFSKHNLTKCIPPSTILPAASTSIKLPSL